MTDDSFDFLAALLDAKVRFLVVAAHTMAVHGVVSGTQDLDLWIDPTRENALRGREMPFLGRDTLVANKRAFGRAKDPADLEALGE